MKTSLPFSRVVVILLTLLFGCQFLSAQEITQDEAAPALTELRIVADQVSYGVESAAAEASGNVEITYGGIVLTCQEAKINQNTRDFAAQGDVVITIPGRGTWKAPALRGNLDHQNLDFGPFRLDTDVWHVGGDGGEALEDGTQKVNQGWLTTCDHEHLHYRLQAKEIIYHPESKTFSAKHLTARIGNVPVFYFPWFYGSTDNTEGTIIRPGYSGKRGAYLRLGRVYQHSENGNSQIFVDGMTKRGLALGQITDYNSGSREVVTSLYGLHDRKPAETTKGFDRRFKSKEDRFRLKLYWREQLDEHWALRINTDYLSDISMLDDWFRHDWRHWGQPKSFAALSYDGKFLHAALTARPRINTFYSVSEKLPELTIDIPRISLFDEIPLVYTSHSSAGYYNMKWRNFKRSREEMLDPFVYDPEIHRDPGDYGAFRADTLHTVQLPLDLGDIITLTPRASIRVTSYSRTSRNRVSEEELADWIDADNPDAPRNAVPVASRYDKRGGSRTRIASELGLEGRSLLLSDWFSFNSQLLETKELRHAIEPYFNYTYAPSPSVDREKLYFFDETDRLEYQNFLRLGIDQRLLSRNTEGKTRSLLSLENYIDIHHREGRETGRHWGDFGTRLTACPREDLRTWATLLHDIGDGEIQRGEVGIRYGTEDDWQFALKYVYRNNHLSRSAYSMGSTLSDFTGESSYIKRHFQSADTIEAQINIPLNSITSLEIAAEYDFEKNNLEEHHYYLTRQIHCWTVMGGVGWDDHDFEVVFMLRLVAFPNVKLDLTL